VAFDLNAEHRTFTAMSEESSPQRNLKLSKPLAIIDVQSTGLDTGSARIVNLTVLKLSPDGTEHVRTVIVNPQVPIPPDASQVHGLTDLDVQDKPVFKAYARALADHLEGCDLAGFGIERFGLRLLLAEFERNGVDFSMTNRVVLDAMTIFHRLEPRNLDSAYRRFVGKERPRSGDESLTARNILSILQGEVASHPSIPLEPQALSDWAKGIDSSRAIDGAAKFVWGEEGDALVNFGKHTGQRLVDVVRDDKGYIDWISKSSEFGQDTRKIAKDALEGYLPER
jgi:DNA polymerase-3 subunit epsilon